MLYQPIILPLPWLRLLLWLRRRWQRSGRNWHVRKKRQKYRELQSVIGPSTFKPQYTHTNSPHSYSYISLEISRESLIKDESIFSLVNIWLILITLSADNVWILLGEIWCWSLLRLKRGSQWGAGFYGYRLKFWLFYGYRLIFFSYG